jgi:hypothetical protein
MKRVSGNCLNRSLHGIMEITFSVSWENESLRWSQHLAPQKVTPVQVFKKMYGNLDFDRHSHKSSHPAVPRKVQISRDGTDRFECNVNCAIERTQNHATLPRIERDIPSCVCCVAFFETSAQPSLSFHRFSQYQEQIDLIKDHTY